MSLISYLSGLGASNNNNDVKRARRNRLSRSSALRGGDLQFELLEHRSLMTINTLSIHEAVSSTPVQDPAGKNIMVPVTATDSLNDAISYTVTSSNSAVTASVVGGDTYLTFNVSAPATSTAAAINGALTFKLFDTLTPNTVNTIKSLVNSGFYTNTTFARVIDSITNLLIAQGGFTSTGASNGTGNTFDDEFNSQLTFDSPGMLAMANAGPDTNDAEFFVTGVDEPNSSTPLTQSDLAETRFLDYRYTIFGQLTSGFSTFDQIMNSTLTTNAATGENSLPSPLITISSASVSTNTQDAVLAISSPSSAAGQTSTVTLTATEADGSTTTTTFTVDVLADSVVDPPFLGAISSTVSTSENTPITITLPAVNPDGATMQYEILDPTTGKAPTNVTIGSFNNTTGQVTLTPASGFTGAITLEAGVSGTNSISSAFDTQQFVLNVTAAVAPGAPTKLTATSTTSTAINLSWTGSTGTVTGYNVYRGTTAGGESTTPLNSTPLAASATTYQDTTGVAGATYFYVIQAINANTTSPNSNEASATIPANVIPPPSAPSTVKLAPSSQMYSGDNYTSNSTPVVDAMATPGDLVTFTVNGKTLTATAGASGLAEVTLPAGDLAVGNNAISVTASNSSGASAASVINMTYAPSDAQVYTVPGTVGQSQTLVISLTSRQAADNDEIGVYEVTNAAGVVDGIAPGAAGYAQAAIGGTANGGQFSQVVFASGSTSGAAPVTITVTGGEQLAFYLIQNNSTANFLSNNPTDAVKKSDPSSEPIAFFTTTSANPDNFQHVKVVSDPASAAGNVQYAWEDGYAGGDRDYNDMVMTVALSSGQTANPAVLQVPGAGGSANLTLNAKLDAGSKDTKASGDVGVFYVDNPAGDIGSLTPGSAGYLAAALAAGNYQVLVSAGEALGASSQISVPAGQFLAFFSISNGTTSNFLHANAANSDAKGLPNAFMTFSAGNPDQQTHFSWTSPEGVATSSSQTNLHVMDQIFGNSNLINDLDLDLSFSGGN